MSLVNQEVGAKIIKEFEVDGEKFWIQYAQEQHKHEIIEAMVHGFTRDQPIFMYKFAGRPPDASLIETAKKSYDNILRSGLSIVCMTKKNDKPVIAGVQCFEISPSDREPEDFRYGKKIFSYMVSLTSLPEDLKTSTYLADQGLFVFPEYRNKKIGCYLLECWKLVCKHAGQEVSIGTFSSKYSQSAAKRAGLTEMVYRLYDDLRKEFPTDIPLGIENHTEGLSLFIVYP